MRGGGDIAAQARGGPAAVDALACRAREGQASADRLARALEAAAAPSPRGVMREAEVTAGGGAWLGTRARQRGRRSSPSPLSPCLSLLHAHPSCSPRHNQGYCLSAPSTPLPSSTRLHHCVSFLFLPRTSISDTALPTVMKLRTACTLKGRMLAWSCLRQSQQCVWIPPPRVRSARKYRGGAHPSNLSR